MKDWQLYALISVMCSAPHLSLGTGAFFAIFYIICAVWAAIKDKS